MVTDGVNTNDQASDLMARLGARRAAGKDDGRPRLHLVIRYPDDEDEYNRLVEPLVHSLTLGSHVTDVFPPGGVAEFDVADGPAGLGPHPLRVESDLRGSINVSTVRDDCEVEVALRADGGSIEWEAITFRPVGPNRTLPASPLARRLLDAELRQQIERTLADRWLLARLGVDWVGATMTPRRTGRAGTDDTFYAVWARRYVRALERSPSGPVKYLAERYNLSNGSIRQYLNHAREKQLLTRPDKGKRAGGRLMPRAHDLLNGIPEED